MKNIYILPTDNPSKLYFNKIDNKYQSCEFPKYHTDIKSTHNLYITSDEEIKEGDWRIIIDTESVLYGQFEKHRGTHPSNDQWKKIILTDNKDLITDGIQAIDDEFLEWFVENPNCEFVEIEESKIINHSFPRSIYNKYKIIIPNKSFTKITDNRDGTITLSPINPNFGKIIIPKEELKTRVFGDNNDTSFWSDKPIQKGHPKQETLEEAVKNYSKNELSKLGFINGVKWQQERSYSEEEMKSETLEDVAEKYAEENQYDLEYFDEGGCQGIEIESFAKKLVDFTTKWQQERSYSEKEVLRIIRSCKEYLAFGDEFDDQKWFEQFKKK